MGNALDKELINQEGLNVIPIYEFFKKKTQNKNVFRFNYFSV